jgi:predicted ATPase
MSLRTTRSGSDHSSEVSSEVDYWKRTIKILDMAAEEGMIEESSETHWKFSHDRVQVSTVCMYSMTAYNFHTDHLTVTQEGLYSMLEESEKENLHMWIGFVVWGQLESKTTIPDYWETFFAVDHLNRGIKQIMKLDGRKHVDISALNLNAARLAMQKGAFSRAAQYVRTGMKLLGESSNKWENHYDLTMALYAIGAEVEYCAGNYEKCNQAAAEVLHHAKVFDEKMVVYFTMINALGAQGRFMDAMDLGFSILREMGVQFPKNPGKVQVVLELRRTYRAIKGRNDGQLLTLPICCDKAIIASIKLLSTMASIAYLKATEPIIFCLLGLRMMRLSCTHGLNKWSCHGFACFAAVQSVLGHRDVAYRFGCLSLDLLEKMGAKEAECRVLVVLNHLVLHWRLPLENAVDGFMRSYKSGLEYGDIGMAFIAAAGVLTTSYYCPCYKLPDIEVIAKTFCEQMFQFNEESVLRVGLPFWQLILNLRGDSEEPWKLAGEAMQRLELLSPIDEADNKMGRHVEQSLRLTLALYFENWDEASLALKGLNAIPGHYTNYLYASTMSLAAFELFRLTGKRRYHKIIKSTMKKLEAWEQEGVKNVRFRLLLLRAENLSLTFNIPTAKAAYDLAIAASVENSDPHYEAVASERAANYFLRKGNQDLAKQYILRSREKYRVGVPMERIDSFTKSTWGCFKMTQAATFWLHPSTVIYCTSPIYNCIVIIYNC